MNKSIQKFLELTKNSKEACLMIAENEKDLTHIEKILPDFGLQKSSSIREIFNSVRDGRKTYFILNSILGNNIYNVLAQYPTGQINAYDGKDNLVANPDYQEGSVLILITKENLEKIEQGEKSLLKLVGLTWQK